MSLARSSGLLSFFSARGGAAPRLACKPASQPAHKHTTSFTPQGNPGISEGPACLPTWLSGSKGLLPLELLLLLPEL